MKPRGAGRDTIFGCALDDIAQKSYIQSATKASSSIGRAAVSKTAG